jgi:hypothetical protein
MYVAAVKRGVFFGQRMQKKQVLYHIQGGTVTKLQNQLKHDIRDPSDTITKSENHFIDQEKSFFRTAHGEVAEIIPHTLDILLPTP